MTVRTPIIGTDTDSSETFRLAMGGLFLPASALNARTGVLTTPVLTGTGSLTATISPFNCVIDGTSNSLQGCYPVAVDLAATVNITPGNTQARIDLICLQIQDNDYDGSGFHRGIPVVVAGVPSGSPAVPATPANAIALWTLPVPALASTITFSTATAVYLYTAAAGGIPAVRNAGDKPAVANGVGFRYRLDVTPAAGTSSALETSTDGVTWSPVYDASAVPASTTAAISAAVPFSGWTTLTAAAGWTQGTIPLQCRTAPGGRVEVRGSISPNSSTVAGAYNATGVVPGAFIPSGNRWFPISSVNVAGSTAAIAFGNISTGGNMAVVAVSTIAANAPVFFDGASYAL